MRYSTPRFRLNIAVFDCHPTRLHRTTRLLATQRLHLVMANTIVVQCNNTLYVILITLSDLWSVNIGDYNPDELLFIDWQSFQCHGADLFTKSWSILPIEAGLCTGVWPIVGVCEIWRLLGLPQSVCNKSFNIRLTRSVRICQTKTEPLGYIAFQGETKYCIFIKHYKD